MERSARFAAVLLLHHGGSVADEFSKNRDRLFAGTVEPINTYAVVAVGNRRFPPPWSVEFGCHDCQPANDSRAGCNAQAISGSRLRARRI